MEYAYVLCCTFWLCSNDQHNIILESKKIKPKNKKKKKKTENISVSVST